MSYTLKQMDKAADKAAEYKKDNAFDSLTANPAFKSISGQKAEWSMWGWYYNELSNMKVELSRVGLLVRLNNFNSTEYLKVYHSHLYTLLLPLSTVIDDRLWKMIDKMWNDVEKEINIFEIRKRTIKNIKIPGELIKKLDALYRISLLMMQKAGLGIAMTSDVDVSSMIESSIIGD